MVGIDVAQKRKKPINSPTLLVGDNVEVRSLDEGFMGSWHSGVVIQYQKGVRKVQYKNILHDDKSKRFNDLIHVHSVVDGVTSVGRMRLFYRGLLRPIPPHLSFNKLSLHYGQCVDAYYREAWWEGVIFDNEKASDVRCIFFPDIGDLMRIRVDNLRISQDWDEYTQEWKPRRTWHLLELIKLFGKKNLLHVSVRQIWYEMRGKKGFQMIKEWTNSVTKIDVWERLLREIIDDHSKLAAEKYYGEVAESMLSLNYENQLKRLDAVNNEDLNAVCYQNTIHGDDVCDKKEIQGDGLSLVCDQLPSNGKRKRKWKIADTEVNTVEEIHGDDLNLVCDQFRTNRGKKQKLKWEIAGEHLVPEAEFCPSSVLEYLNHSSAKKNVPTPSLALKLRKHLAYLGWKVEFCSRDGEPRMRYTSPDGKCYMSLVTVCKSLDTFSKNVFAPPLPPPHHIDTFQSSISIEPNQDIRAGDEVSGKLITSEKFSSSILNDFFEFSLAKSVVLEEHCHEGTCRDNDVGAEVNVVPLVTEEKKIYEDHLISKSNAEEEGEKLDLNFSSSSNSGIRVEVFPSAPSMNDNNSFMLQDSNRISNNFFPLLFERPVEKKNYYGCQVAEHGIVPEAGICSDSIMKSKMKGLGRFNLTSISNSETTHEEIPCSLPSIVPCSVAISVNEISRQEELNIVEKELPNSNNKKKKKHNWEIAATDVVPETESMNHCVLLGSEEKYENTVCPKNANYDELREKGNKHLMGLGCNLTSCEAYAEGEVNNGVEKALVSEPKQNINIADEAFDKLIDIQGFPSNLQMELGEFENEKYVAIVEHQNEVSQSMLPSGMTNGSVSTACEAFNFAGLVSEPKQNTNVADEALGKLIATQRFPSNPSMEVGEFEKDKSFAIGEHQNDVSPHTLASGMTNSSVTTICEAYSFDGESFVSVPKQNIKIADEAPGKLVNIQRVPTNLQMEFGENEMEKFSAIGGTDGVPPCSSNSLDQLIGQKTCSSEEKEKEEFAFVSLAAKRLYFSRLIDNGVVSPGVKVYYHGKRSGASFKEGQITREGIMCNCCQNVFGLSKFEAHAGSTYRRPAANIHLEDGRSLSQCQLQLKCRDNLKKTFASPPQRKSNHDNIKNIGTPSRQPKSNPNKIKKIATQSPQPKRSRGLSTNDSICSVCQFGGQLILCHQCPSSFHQECLDLKVIPDDEWFCLSCRCGICERNKFNRGAKQNMEGSVLNCHQCERIYHVGCLFKQGDTNIDRRHKEKWFCNKKCEQIFLGLRKLLGRPVVVGDYNLTWTLLKYSAHNDLDDDGMDPVEILSNLNLAVSLINECFGPLKEPRTKIDIAKDVIFSRGSNVKRLNFQGFYTVLLSRDDELISVSAVRVYGEKVAEVPLIGTRFQYRRKGMCRLLMNVLEKKLMELGVERLVVPVTPNVLSTWTASFGLLETTISERLNFLSYTFLDFPGTSMCHKILTQSAPSTRTQQNIHESVGGSDNADISKKIGSLEIFQVERTEDEIMSTGTKSSAVTTGVNGSGGTFPLILRV